MFEGCLVESRGLIGSRTQRWSALGSAAFQLMLAALIVVIPMLRPQTLKIFTAPPTLTVSPPPALPPEPPVRVETSSTTASQAFSSPAASAPIASGTTRISLIPGIPDDSAPTAPITSLQLGPGPTGMPSLGEEHAGPSIAVVRAAPSRPLPVSGGVSQGMLLAPIRPAYPEIARVTHTQGTVVVEATISKAGRVESAHASSGPPMLRQAALDAVAAARYRPYLLSGEPVEVQTTVTVVFKLGE